MSIRCQIGFYYEGEKNLKNWQALVYRHIEGDPESVLADVIPILKDVDEAIGLQDVEYASAYLVKELKTDYWNIGISKEFHGDIDYYYAVYPNLVRIYHCRYGQPYTEWELIKTINLGDEKNE